jgi:hypothetical protein
LKARLPPERNKFHCILPHGSMHFLGTGGMLGVAIASLEPPGFAEGCWNCREFRVRPVG